MAPGTLSKKLKTVQLKSGRTAVADRVLVRFDPRASDTEIAAIHGKANTLGAGNARSVKRLGPSSIYLVDVTGAASLEDAVHAYQSADAKVLEVGLDMVGHLDETPNDPLFSQQWNMSKIQAPQAWNRTHGFDDASVAVLDSGVDASQPDLAGKVQTAADFSDSGTNDVVGHGTHVAGIVAGAANNGRVVAGVGYRTRIISGKVLDFAWWDDQPVVMTSDLADAIYWASLQVPIITMSLGGGDSCDPSWYEDLTGLGVRAVRDAIDVAWSRGSMLIASAGNNNNTSKQWPAACPHVVSVANTNNVDGKSFHTSFGPWVTVTAPGDNILSTMTPGAWVLSNGCTAAGGSQQFALCTGTSMAAPHVAGLAALVRQSCRFLNPQDVVDRITSTADQIPGTGSDWQFGRVNAQNAVCLPAPGGLSLGTVTGGTLQLRWYDYSSLETSYNVAYRAHLTGAWSYVSAHGGTVDGPVMLNYTLTTLAPGTLYDFQVQSCLNALCSAWSNMVSGQVNSQLVRALVTGGTGRVTSTPAGISCGVFPSDCQEFYPTGSSVSLYAVGLVNTATHDEFDFDHWEGACSGTSPVCTLTVNASLSATAVMVKVGNSGP